MEKKRAIPLLPVGHLLHAILQRRSFAWILALAVMIGLGITTIYRGGFSPSQRTDLTVFIRAGQALAENENIYEVTNLKGWNYVYAPLLAVLIKPFHGLPLSWSVSLWYLLALLSIGGAFWIGIRLFSTVQHGLLACSLAAIFSLPLLLNAISRGQLGALMLFLQMAVFLLYFRGRKIAAGFLLGFSVVLKISPLAFVFFFFLFKKEWKVLFAGILGILFFLFVFPGFFIGFEKNFGFVAEWLRVMQLAMADRGNETPLWRQLLTPFLEDNQSGYAVLTRWFWPSDESIYGESNFGIRLAVQLFTAGMLGIFFWIAKKSTSRQHVDLLFAEFSLYPLLMLLTAPVAEMHHFTVLFASAIGIFLLFDQEKLTRAERILFDLALWSCLLAFTFGLIFDDLAYQGIPFLGTFLVFSFQTVFLALKSDKF
ncbi:MAG: glycosyltransferase family 87 protein [Candidatus Omnitrophota bacterium]